MNVEIFVSGKKKLSVQKYPDACGWRLKKDNKKRVTKNKQTNNDTHSGGSGAETFRPKQD